MKFNEKLKEARKRIKMTQVQLAEKCNVTQGTVANWERGAREPDIDTIKMISTILHVPVDYFFDVDPPEDNKKAPPPDEERWKRNRDKVDGLPDETKERLMEQIEALIDIEVHRGQ